MTTSSSRFRVFVRDRPTVDAGDLPLIGEIDTFRSFEATTRHNDIGSWQLKLTDAFLAPAGLIRPGRGIAVFRDDEPTWPVFSGPISQIDTAWSRDDGHSVTVTGPCDNSLFRERIARINPDTSLAYEAQADYNDVVPTEWAPAVIDFIDFTHVTQRTPNNTGEWIWSLLAFNYTNYWYSGDSDDSRAVRYLKLVRQLPPEIKALPADTAWKGYPINMTDLSTVVFQAAEAAGLSVRLIWQPRTRTSEPNTSGPGIYLNIARVNDVSDRIVFGPDQGNLSAYTLSSVAPEATRMFIEAETTQNDRRWLGYRRNTLFDPSGWKSWEDRNSLGEHYLAADWSDPNNGRHAIEVDWNVTAEKYEDARDIPWPYQPEPTGDSDQADDPNPGTAAAAQVDKTSLQFMVDNGPKGVFSMTTLDVPGSQYGKDYFVSDIVRILVDTSFFPASMRTEDGVIRDIVREAKISSSADGIWQVQPAVGTADSSPTPWIYRQVKKLKKRLAATTDRTEGDQTAAVRPYTPHISIVTQGWSPDAPTHTFDKTDRPRPDPVYVQLYVNSIGLVGDPRFPLMGETEVALEYRNGENGDWKAVPTDQIYYSKTAKTTDADYHPIWYHNSNLTGGVNSVRYWRCRFVRNGVYSAWSNVLKVTAAPGPLNTSGTLTLNTPDPATRHQFAQFYITGIDTTYGSLQLQSYESSSNTWFGVDAKPTYVNNSFSFPFTVDANAGTVQLRVQSFDNADHVIGLVKTSNTITLNVVAP